MNRRIRVCRCEDGQNDPDHTGLCIDCGGAWELLEGEVEAMNVYTALLFQSRRDLHLTVRYYAKMEKAEVDALAAAVQEWSKRNNPRPFTLRLGQKALFGPRRNIPVLLAQGEWPTWMEGFRNVYPTKVPDSYPFNPHVTTPDEPMELVVTAVALMEKKNIVYLYDCQAAE